MERYTCDAVVVGAGAVGLAIARALAVSGRETIILERNRHIGAETSSRSSEVVHAGLYYPTGSQKARHCVAGRKLLYQFCETRGIAAPRLGKLIVANSNDQCAMLASIKTQAEANGVSDLRFLARGEAARLEPEVACVQALFSPSTGIFDSHQFMLALLGDALSGGASLVVNAHALRVDRGTASAFAVFVRNGGHEIRLDARILINAAGLWAPAFARCIDGLSSAHVPNTFFAKGNYARLARRSPFTHPVYPIPEAGGLGIHVTVDLGGQARFGPDVEWLSETNPSSIDYRVDPSVCRRFADRVKSYWPAVRAEDLEPDYAGVRPKLSGPGEPAADFRIDGPSVHSVPGLVNLFGIESPGLTAALSIAETLIGEI